MAAPPSGPTGTIELMQSAETAARSVDRTDSSLTGLTYGDQARFHTTVDGGSKKGYTYISLVCTQDESVVYQSSGYPEYSFPLQDPESRSLEWDSTADADCEAWLIYRVDKGKSSEITMLAATDPFVVSAKGA